MQLELPVLGACRPAVQLLHFVLASSDWYVPPAHAVQRDWPCSSWYRPFAQLVHATWPVEAVTRPARHGEQATAAGTGAWYPAWHAWQAKLCVSLLKCPLAQGLHFVAPVVEYLPARQDEQFTFLEAGEKVPAAQATQPSACSTAGIPPTPTVR